MMENKEITLLTNLLKLRAEGIMTHISFTQLMGMVVLGANLDDYKFIRQSRVVSKTGIDKSMVSKNFKLFRKLGIIITNNFDEFKFNDKFMNKSFVDEYADTVLLSQLVNIDTSIEAKSNTNKIILEGLKSGLTIQQLSDRKSIPIYVIINTADTLGLVFDYEVMYSN